MKLKILVWVLTLLIIMCLALLVIGISLGWHKDSKVEVYNSNSSLESSFDIDILNQPEGTVIDSIDMFENQFAITLSGGGVLPRIVFINPMTGKTSGTINLKPTDLKKRDID